MTTGAVGVSVSLLPGTSDIGEMRVPLPAQGHDHTGLQASSGFVSWQWLNERKKRRADEPEGPDRPDGMDDCSRCQCPVSLVLSPSPN
jgi:hypothetical protein